MRRRVPHKAIDEGCTAQFRNRSCINGTHRAPGMNDIYFQSGDQLVHTLEKAQISLAFPNELNDLRVSRVNFVTNLLLVRNRDEGLYVTVSEKPPQQFDDLSFLPCPA